jgi:hypothetical protein
MPGQFFVTVTRIRTYYREVLVRFPTEERFVYIFSVKIFSRFHPFLYSVAPCDVFQWMNRLTIRLLLVGRLRMCDAIPPLQTILQIAAIR